MYSYNFPLKTAGKLQHDKKFIVKRDLHLSKKNPIRNNYIKGGKEDEEKISSFSVTGIDKLFDPSYKLLGKIIWLAVLITTSTLCIIQLHRCTSVYFSYPTVTDISIVAEAKIQFPAIYLCNGLLRNLFHTPLMTEYDTCQQIMDKCFQQNKFDTNSDDANQFCFQRCDQKNVQLKAIFDKSSGLKNIDEVWKNVYGIRRSYLKAFTACKNEERPNCTSEGFPIHLHDDLHLEFVSAIWGNCIILHRDYEVNYRGPLTYIKLKYKNPIFEGSNQTLTRNVPGLMLYVHHRANKSMRHFLFASTQEILQGFLTHVVIQKKRFKKADLLNSPCVEEESYYECIINCQENYVKKQKSTCSLPYHDFPKLKRCKLEEFSKVLTSDFVNYSRFNSSQCGCLKPCTETVHTTTNDVIVKFPKDELMILKIYFGDDSYIMSEKNTCIPFQSFLVM